jgi:predicted Zn-dependent protease
MPGSWDFDGHYHDGRIAVRHAVAITVGAEGLLISGDEGQRIDFWPYASLRATAGSVGHDEIRLSCLGRDGAGLTVRSAEFVLLLQDRAPGLAMDREAARLTPRRTLGYGALIAAFCLLVYFGLPVAARWAVPFVPPELEHKWGATYANTLVTVLGGRVCADPAGRDALGQLTARLAALADSPHPLEVRVIEMDVVNAVALPGGHIFIFSELIEEAGSADELAGVLAHEIGHVVARDVLVGMIEGFGLRATLGMVFGGAGWIDDDLISGLVGLSYTRGMEAGADGFAAALLERAGIRRDGFVRFFERMERKDGGSGSTLGLLSTHPASAERARALRADRGGGPAMSNESWAALKRICRTKSLDRSTAPAADILREDMLAAVAAARSGDHDLAIRHFNMAMATGDLTHAQSAFVFTKRGDSYWAKGDHDKALADYNLAILFAPDDAGTWNTKAWLLATSHVARIRDGAEAVRLAQEAVKLENSFAYRDTLAAAHAEAGQFQDAVREQESAIAKLPASVSSQVAAEIKSRLALYRAGKPYRE